MGLGRVSGCYIDACILGDEVQGKLVSKSRVSAFCRWADRKSVSDNVWIIGKMMASSPVTMATFPLRSGTSSKVNLDAGGKNWDMYWLGENLPMWFPDDTQSFEMGCK